MRRLVLSVAQSGHGGHASIRVHSVASRNKTDTVRKRMMEEA